MRFIFAIVFLFGFAPISVEAEPANSIDEFVNRIDTALSAGAPYEGFVETIDPWKKLTAGLNTLTTALLDYTGGIPLRFREMFRHQSRPNGATIIGAIVDEGDRVMFIAFVLLRLDDGWYTVNVSLKSDYSGLLKYH